MTRKFDGQHFAASGLGAAILDSAHALVITLDTEGQIVGFNRACELLSGYEAEEVVGGHVWDRLVSEEDVGPIRQLFATLKQGGEILEEYENAWVTKDGRRPIIAWNNSVVRNVAGEVELVVGIGVDVTERKANSDRLARAQQTAKIGSWEWTIATDQHFWSDQMYRNLGLAPGGVEAGVDKFYELVHPDDREGVRRRLQATIETGKPYSYDFRVVWPDGTERLVHEEGEALLGGSGEIVGLAGTTQDVTELRATENHLQRLIRSFTDAQRIARIGNWDWDAATKVEWWSDEVYRIMGLEPASATASYDAFMERTHPDDREMVADAIEAAQNSLGSYNVDFRIVRPDGGVRVVRETGECALDSEGRLTGLTGTVQDITKQHEAERELSETARRLQTALRLTSLGTWEWDPESDALLLSNETARICGLGKASVEIPNEKILEMIQQDDRDRAMALMVETLKTGESYTNEYRITRPDGDVRAVIDHAERFVDKVTGKARIYGTLQDITERKTAEEKLRETAVNLENAQRIAHLGSWVWEIGEDKEWWSDEMYRMFGMEVGSVILSGYGFLDYVHPDDRERVRAAQDKSLNGGVPYVEEYRLRRIDGREITISEYGEMEYDANGKPLRMHGTAQDITERKAVEEKLRETAENLKETQRIGKLGSWVWEIGEDKEWWSDEIYRIRGMEVEPGVVSGFEYLEYMHPDDREHVHAALDKSLREKVPYVAEYRVRHADGHEIILSELAETEYDGAGKPIRMRGTTQDITDRKQAELVLQQTMERLEEAQRIGQMGSWTWDPDEDLEWWSDQHYRIFGFEPGSIVLDVYGFLKYVHPDDRDRVEKIQRQAVATHTPFSVEYRVIWPDGTERIVSEHGELIDDDSSGKPQWRGVLQDITDRNRIEQELARLNAELEQRVEQRTAELRAAQGELVKSERLATLGQLTATVSHELRNPLGAMRTSMYVVEKKTDADDQRLRAAIDRVNRNITRCDQIIDELLDYTRIRDLNIQQMNIDNWLGAVLSEQTVPDGVEVTRKLRAGGARISADSDRLRRAVINIFENACQAAADPWQNNALPHAPKVTVETRLRNDRLEILIMDNGPGVPADIREKIFEPLFSTKNFGVGLGLPTVKQIMEQHGGGVEIGKKRGGGAKFALWLPVAGELEISNT